MYTSNYLHDNWEKQKLCMEDDKFETIEWFPGQFPHTSKDTYFFTYFWVNDESFSMPIHKQNIRE